MESEPEARGQRTEVGPQAAEVQTSGLAALTYAETIEDEFIRLRGRGLCLSSADIALIADWFRRGVPLHVPMNALAQVEKYLERGGRGSGGGRQQPVRIRGLAYIREEVEANFAELVEGHVGCGGCEKSYCGK